MSGYDIEWIESVTPKVFNVDNPLQAEGAARGIAARHIAYIGIVDIGIAVLVLGSKHIRYIRTTSQCNNT
jgi:hypothetical protein